MVSKPQPLAVIVFITLVVAFTIANLCPTCQVFLINLPDDDVPYRHGWPLTYMTREASIPFADFPSSFYKPWPFYENPILLDFQAWRLAIDIVVAACLIVLATLPVISWERHAARKLRFNTRHLLILITVVAALLAIDRATGGYVIFFSSFFWPAIAGILVLLSIPLAIFSLVQFARALYLRRG